MSQKSLKIGFTALLGLGLAVSQLQAAVTINISAEKLKDPGGYAMAVGGVLVLVADANRDGFGGAGDTSFVTGDDVMVRKWDIATGGGNAPGAFSGTTGSVSFSGDWDAGDPLAIYWFPTLTAADSAPGAAVPFGMFRVLAENNTLSGTLDPMQATTNAANAGTGSGTITGDYNSVTNTLNYSVTWQGLATAVSNMHFHRAPVGVSGGVDLGIPANGGTGVWTSPAVGNSVVLTDAQEANLGLGRWYANIHTADFGSGEIRGQVIISGNAGGSAPDGTDAWATPEDGTLGHNLVVITTDATVLNPDGGSTNAAVGLASSFTPGAGPAAPTGIAGAADGPMISVTWTDNATDETGYRVERSLSASSGWAILGQVGAGIGVFVDDTVTPGTEYFYRVLALRGPSQSAYNTSAAVQAAVASAKMTNISTRALVQTGDNILIASFQLSGGPLRIYSKVAGPGLETAGIVGFLADPLMELVKVSDGSTIATNDSWRSDQEALIQSTFIPPVFDVEPALVAELTEAGFYSVVVRGVNDTTGFANLEIYDFNDAANPTSGKITNLSTRALVQTGDDILIASFLVAGEGSQRIYSRVIGPGLEAAGIAGFLADPLMELVKVSDGSTFATNGDWKDTQQALIESTFIPPGFDVESALVATITEAGFYSVVVRGVNDGTGFANVELYDFPE